MEVESEVKPTIENKIDNESVDVSVEIETDKNVIRDHANESLIHNLEVQCADYLIENKSIDMLPQLSALEKDNIPKICPYLLRISSFIDDSETKEQLYEITYELYIKYKFYYEAMIVALKIDSDEKISQIFEFCKDPLMIKQLCILLSRQHYYAFHREEYESLLRNYNLSSIYQTVAEELGVKEAKTPKEIYKFEPPNGYTISYEGDCYVNAIINAGHCKDRFSMDVAGETMSGIPAGKDLKTIDLFEAAAGLGAIYMWNIYDGLNVLSPLLHSSSAYTAIGAILGVGICSSQVYIEDEDLPLNLLYSFLKTVPEANAKDIDIDKYCSSLLAIGLAYAGTQREDIKDLVISSLEHSSDTVIMCSMLCIALLYVGHPEIEVVSSLLQTAGGLTETQMKAPLGIMAGLALALVFMNSRNQYEDLFLPLITAFDLPPLYLSYVSICVRSMCYFGTGDMNIIQEFLIILSDMIPKEEDALAQKACVFGLVFLCMGEPLSTKMVYRQLELLITLSSPPVKNIVPLAYALLSPSSPNPSLMDIIIRKTAGIDREKPLPEAKPALFALGLMGAGTNAAKISNHLRNLMTVYTNKRIDIKYIKRIMGMVYLGKGLLSLSPIHTDRQLLCPTSLACLLLPIFYQLCTIGTVPLYESMFSYMMLGAAYPSCVALFDENDKVVKSLVRVGQAVDITGVAGNPRPISGFQTNEAPLLMNSDERAIIVDNQGIQGMTAYLEGICYVKSVDTNPKN
ncbi:hypothetical protein WA158_006164 [Blastocystis sp. Blastoise]